MNAIKILEQKLIGNFISRFSVGDTWDFYFGGFRLVAQNVIASEEDFLNDWLYENFNSSKTTVDKGYISKCAIVSANMRKEVIGLKLDKSCNLTIEFKMGCKLLIPSNEKIVDWQWCLNETGEDPYHDYLIACFVQGEIQVKNESNIKK